MIKRIPAPVNISFTDPPIKPMPNGQFACNLCCDYAVVFTCGDQVHIDCEPHASFTIAQGEVIEAIWRAQRQ